MISTNELIERGLFPKREFPVSVSCTCKVWKCTSCPFHGRIKRMQRQIQELKGSVVDLNHVSDSEEVVKLCLAMEEVLEILDGFHDWWQKIEHRVYLVEERVALIDEARLSNGIISDREVDSLYRNGGKSTQGEGNETVA